MTETLKAWEPRILSLLRVMAALLFIEHGTMKLFGFPAPMGPSHLPPLLMTAGIIEVFGGALLVLGLFTRPAAFLLSGEMAVAYFMFHAPQNFFPSLNEGDAAILFCFIFLYLVFSGPGSWSLDAMFRTSVK